METTCKLACFAALSLLFSVSTVQADPLCDNGCNLVIEFTGDSRIEAVEALTISFGDGGLVNTGASSTAYANGDTFPMNAGETLDFSAGGRLDLGQGGNIDYSVISFNIVGNISIGDSSGGSTNLYQGSSLTVDGNLSISGGLTNSGFLDVSSGTIDVSGGGSGSTLFNGGGSGSVTLTGGGTVNAGANNLLVFTPSLGGNTGITLPNSGSLQGGTLVINAPAGITASSAVFSTAELTPLSVENLAMLQGIEIPTADGGLCTVENETCLAADGREYRLENGEFVPVSREQSLTPSSGGGGLFGPVLFSLFLLIQFRRSRITAFN